ncbi:aldehyde dehydrogenase family protein [Mycobacterium sp. 21AC1]|uniref:aldehyde dehydrogenase family protein n=1 Tax=[Mycobacterium] appelbergii TaxID=2939269 RepID=UPI0029390A48|nr:aldehyde dehydrogenase family protein [Mycobacterium sp. 21AC1]MDV3125982.1 aldehyde dehydrogenase family protein [Mycobacterium sp. 21AC1]
MAVTAAATGCLIDPRTGRENGRVPVGREAQVDAAYTEAVQAFTLWSRTTPGQRQESLLGIADEMEDLADEFVEAECRDTGKLPDVFHAEELMPIIDQMRFFAGAARTLEGRAAGEYVEGHTSMIRREPVGVVAAIAPWNYPLMTAVWKLAPALAAGNAVVFKPDAATPSSALLLQDICERHLPPGAVTVVCGDRTTGELVASHPDAAMVALTGSVEAGVAVARNAAADLRRTHLELGGNAPVLVFEDADVHACASMVSGSAYYNAGQDCTAPSRILVHDSVADELTAALVREAHDLLAGDADDPNHGRSPLISESQRDRVTGLVARIGTHAQLLTGGAAEPRPGFFFQPTVITGVKQSDEIVQEEIFGPVLTIQRFATEDEALDLANGVRQGLAAGVWTRDVARAFRVTSALDFGVTWVNTHVTTAAEMPHGGFKCTGGAQDLSIYGLEAYTRIKHVLMAWS